MSENPYCALTKLGKPDKQCLGHYCHWSDRYKAFDGLNNIQPDEMTIPQVSRSGVDMDICEYMNKPTGPVNAFSIYISSNVSTRSVKELSLCMCHSM